jgi:putative CocE/NonD family hydrolase
MGNSAITNLLKRSAMGFTLACIAMMLSVTGESMPQSRQGTSGALVPMAGQEVSSEILQVPIRDGVLLTATVWRPKTIGRYPIILIRSPYPRLCCTIPQLAGYFVDHGYAVVSQDVRGRGDSGGVFGFWFQEVNDGYDTIEWLAAQAWTNGRVGMMGPSYPGFTQWLAARAHPPHLVCIVPTSAGGDYFRDFPYMGGAFMEYQALSWVDSMTPRSASASDHEIDIVAMPKYQPLETADLTLAARKLPLYQELLAHHSWDSYWKRIAFEPDTFAGIDLPALHITGWYDWAQGSEIFMWNGMRRSSPARNDQQLVIGAWTHDGAFFGGTAKVGIWDIPQQAILDMKLEHLAFFDRYLKQDSKAPAKPRVRIFVTGADEWRTLEDYPIPTAEVRRMYLHSGGHANSAKGDGTLSWTVPTTEQPDQYEFIPNPRDWRHAWLADPEFDRGPMETRRIDLLTYTGPVLETPVEVIGRPIAELYFASDAPDTDVVVTILDIQPDGRARVLAEFPGVIRARYRHGIDHEEFLTPGKTELLQIPLADIAHRFLPGHRIRLEINSCAAPMMNINPNTGQSIASNVGWRVAHNTIFHQPDSASRLLLPVVPVH